MRRHTPITAREQRIVDACVRRALDQGIATIDLIGMRINDQGRRLYIEAALPSAFGGDYRMRVVWDQVIRTVSAAREVEA